MKATILEAAARTIGRYGYAGCSIARVAKKAGIAHGTFYAHFKSQQDMFDELLPTMVDELLEGIRDVVYDVSDILELEKAGLKAHIEYLRKHPYAYRVTNEAEVYAPEAYHRCLETINRGYTRALRRIIKKSDLAIEPDEERINTMAIIMEAARIQILQKYGVVGNKVIDLPQNVIDTYMTFVGAGINAMLKQA